MVFDRNESFEGKVKKPRIKVTGKLVGINCNSSLMKVFDVKEGKFSWLQLSVIVGKDGQNADIYKNITAYDVKMKEMPELARADELLKAKKKPKVELECYEVTKDAFDKATKEPIMEEVEEQRGSKLVIVQRQKKWLNYRMTEDDVKKTFKILAEEAEPGAIVPIIEEEFI